MRPIDKWELSHPHFSYNAGPRESRRSQALTYRETTCRTAEERGEIFPKARASRKLDLVAMRDEIAARKEELMGETA